MERVARARFWVFRINRWSLALVLLAALALLLLPGRQLKPADVAPTAMVRPGVKLKGRDFSGKSEAEARAMLQQMAAEVQRPAIGAQEARYSDGNSYVIPEVDGYSLDVDNTWRRLAAAPANSMVEPVTRVHKPSKTLADYPRSVIRQGNASKQAVGLLINVDWGTEDLISMLPVLKTNGVHVTFFVSGRWADANPKLLQKMAADGHEIATHGYDLSAGPTDLLRSGTLKSDIQRSVESIKKITGKPVMYYAPHKSEVNADIVKTAADLQLRTVLYSLDTVDWRADATPEKILSTISNAMPGDLILLHPKPNTAKVLDSALKSLGKKGLKPLTLTEMLKPES